MAIEDEEVRTAEAAAPTPTPSGEASRTDRAHARRRRIAPRRGTKSRRPRRVLRVVAIAVVVVLIPIGWSYAHALTAPGSAGVFARTVEWIADHGGRGLVNRVEGFYYEHHKPPVGGTPAGGIPDVGAAAPTSPTRLEPPHLTAPGDIAPIATHPLPHEGDWRPYGQRNDGVPTMYVAFLRPDRVHTSLLTGVVWMDPRLLQMRLVPGVQDPGGTGWQWLGEVPPGHRRTLVAAFNSGFKLRDSQGGYYSEGRTVKPLVNGKATIVLYRDGTANVGAWGREVHMTSDVASARQNLSLLVDGGKPVAGLASQDFHLWGATWGNTLLVWRSAVGVTADGALVYAAGDGLSVASLANVMARAGCVRAMELDINHTWVSFNTYAPTATGIHAEKLLAGMMRPATRYLSVDERDFFAVMLRRVTPAPTASASPAPG